MSNYAKYKSEEEFLEALKEKSLSLHKKLSKFQAFIKSKIDSLQDEAKRFVEAMLADLSALTTQILAGGKLPLEGIKKTAKGHVSEFEKLSDTAKEDLKKKLPKLTSYFTGNPSLFFCFKFFYTFPM
ncbi:unnamed protein product [Strongylus vulgaris]|uniref:Fatty-acid and retinol-binding protein 1 n=1 Tax=Strongylus vulgaris TaxID=40348 RepID=A0A3P7J715_STRVU|nr:unnamed protein product [Strongylus vulgaris]